MAATRRTAGSRQPKRDNRTRSTDRRQFYVYGNAVPDPEYYPKGQPEVQQKRAVQTSSQVRKNRKRALNVSPAYAMFLTFAAVCAVAICVFYLQLQSNIVSRSENVTALQEELADLTEANDTAYNTAADSVNLEAIRSKAMNEMGMVYAAQGNVIEYDSPTSDYVKQYNDIPSSGVLAKSKDISK